MFAACMRQLETYGPRRPRLAESEGTDPLVARIRDGDVAAFEALYMAYFDRLWRFAYRIVGSSDAAYDVVQDVFASVWTERLAVEITGTVRSYIYGVARNRALMLLRRQGMMERTTTSENLHWAVMPSPSDDPRTAAEETDLRQAVREALAQLPERQRAAVELRWLNDLTFAEIGTAMGISPQGARKLVAEGARRLEPLRGRFSG